MNGNVVIDTAVGVNTSEITISNAIGSITNDGTNGSISIVDSQSFIIGANQIDLVIDGTVNSAIADIASIGDGVNIRDLTFEGGAGLAENETITVNGSELTFGSGTVNHASNTITLNDVSSVLNLGTDDDNGTINLNANILNNDAGATINKDFNTVVNINGNKSAYTGVFSQTAGTTVITDGSYFFGGNNTVAGGELVLENGGHFAEGSVNNITGAGLNDPYGTLVLKNDELGPENTVIDWAAGKVTITDSPSDADVPYTNEITIDKGGLHLANGWVQESNYEDGFALFEGQTGIRELELSNGSGILGNIKANDHSILTYNDGAFIDDKATIAMGDDVTVNLNFNEDTVFDTNIVTATSGGDVSNINKNGTGNVSMANAIGNAASGEFVNTSNTVWGQLNE